MSIENPQLELPRGTVIQKQFRVERELGRGAMGVVYLATQLDLDRPVALKVFSIEDADVKDPGTLFNEARAAGALSHLNIVQIYSAGRAESGIGYFAMEYVAGETLGTAIKREKRLDVETALKLAQEVAAALDHGWRRLGLTHGDIKPDNVMLTVDGVAKLADFGLARADLYERDEDDMRLTPLYAAPEMVTGEWARGDCHADMYSFGATLYHMIAGHPPFPGEDPHEVMKRQVHDRPVSLALRVPGLPDGVSGFVDSLLAKNPGDRPASWEAVTRRIGELRTVAQKKLHPHLTLSRQKRSPGRRRPAAAAARVARRRSSSLVRPMLFLATTILLLVTLISIRLSRPAGNPGSRRQARQEPPRNAPAKPNPREALPPEESPNGEDTPPPEKQEDDLETARRLAEEREMSPDPDERTESLTEELERMEREQDNQPPADPDQRAGDDDDPGEDNGGVDPEVQERMADEAYMEIMGRIVRLEWTPGAPVPASLRAAVNEWMETHGVEPGPSGKVQFLKTRVLPAAEQYIHHLVLRHESLRGAPLPDARFEGQNISKVTREGVEMARVLPFGRSTTMHGWHEFRGSPRLMLHLGTRAFADKSLPLTELRPFLATLLLAGQTDLLTARLRAMPREGEETRLWTELVTDYDSLQVEKRAVSLWRQAQEAAARGSSSEALRAIDELRRLDTPFVDAHAEEIKALEEQSYEASPARTAAIHIEETLKLVAAQPAEALKELAELFTDFGSLDYPEKIDAAAARRRALTALASSPHYEAAVANTNPLLTEHGKYCLKRLHEIQASANEGKPPSGMDALLYEGFRSSLLMDLGDWLGSVQTFPYSILTEHARDVLPSDRLHLAHTAVRLANRYSPNGASAIGLDLFDDIAASRGEDENAAAGIIAHALELGLECGQNSFANWKAGRRPPDIPPWAYWQPHRRRLLFVQASWMLMHNYRRNAAIMAAHPIHWFDNPGPRQTRPGGPFGSMLHRLNGTLNEDSPLLLVSMPIDDQPLTAPFWRAAVSDILSRDSEAIWDQDLPTLEEMATSTGSGPLQASLWSDLAVLSLAKPLARGDFGAAAEKVLAFQENLPRDVLPCRPELRFYQAGIDLLRNRRAAASDTLKNITLSGLAAADERQLADYWYKRLTGADAQFSPAGKSRRAIYYHLWMGAANGDSGQTRFQRSRALNLMAERAATPARAAFCQKVATLFNSERR